MMEIKNKAEPTARYSFVARLLGYLLIQAFLLMLISSLPWPIVGYETWGGHNRGRLTPEPVWALYWAQLAVGLFLPIRGKAFLLAQYVVFTLAFLLLGQVEGSERYGHAVVSPTMYTVYWFQFCATALGLISWRYRRSRALAWYPLITYFAIQLATVWGISEIRLSLGPDVGNWVLLAFVVQCVGLLFAPSRIRVVVAAEIFLGVVIAALPSWSPSGRFGSPDLVDEMLWVVYLLQCAGISCWLWSRPKTAGSIQETCKTHLNDRDSEDSKYT